MGDGIPFKKTVGAAPSPRVNRHEARLLQLVGLCLPFAEKTQQDQKDDGTDERSDNVFQAH